MRRVVVLGSTGAVGQQALEVVRTFPGRLQVVGLAANTSHHLLQQQAAEFHPTYVYYSEDAFPEPPPGLAGLRFLPMEEMVAQPDVDLVVNATVSAMAGLPGTLAAVRTGKRVAIANKEVMTMAGGLLVEAARKGSAELVPVDAALSAIWQCLQGEPGEVRRVILTAQEGPFVSRAPMETAPPAQPAPVLHLTWRRGKKAHVDAMTLMSAGMQAIEINALFGIPLDRIEVVAHPEGIIRSMVEFADGSVKAVLSQPTLQVPLQYALSYPERWPNHAIPPLDLVRTGRLTFHPVDLDQYPCLRLALEAGKQGGTAPTVLNAANEVAAWAFLTQQIGLNELPRVIEQVLAEHDPILDPTLEDIRQADAWAREEAPRFTAW